MGKWTPNYTDNVLHNKISSLITGAINRAAVEKEPIITYEEFVNELDTGDAFTTSLLDILVKELADRHNRPYQNDERRLITSRTYERLLSLANPRQVYHGERPTNRNHTGRRTYTFPEYMSVETELDDDENDFGSLLDATTGAAEGARFNTDLFEAYGASHPWSSVRRLDLSPGPSPPEEEAPVWRPFNAPGNTGRINTSWAAVAANNSSGTLTRHASLRRPQRSRMVDFNDFTSRRRSAVRDTLGTQAENSEGTSQTTGENPQTVRRFFPSYARRLERRSDPWEEQTPHDLGIILPLHRDSSPTRDSPGGADGRPHPRLRRGGVRPPEVLYRYSYSGARSRSADADPGNSTPAITSAPNTTSPPSGQPGTAESSARRESNAGDVGLGSTEVVGYPTPGSVDNDPALT